MDGLRGTIQVRTVRRLLAATAAVAAVAVAGAACSSGGEGGPAGPAPPPPGFTRYQGPTYTIAYPTGWTVTTRPNPGGGPATLVVTGPAGSGGFTPQIAVGHDTGYASSFDDAMDVFRTVAVGTTGRLVADRPATLAGAARAQRTEYTEQHPGADGRRYTIRLVELHALTPGRTMFDVLVRAPEQDFATAQLATALDSFRVTSP